MLTNEVDSLRKDSFSARIEVSLAGVTSNRGAARATVVCKEKAVVGRSAARRSFIAARLKSCAQDVIGGSVCLVYTACSVC